MRAYVINLDRAGDRWAHIEASFAKTEMGLCRVPAVEGRDLTLPSSDFSERRFRWFHGRGTNPFEIACYYSHLKAMKTFLETEENHALIAEDDIFLGKDLDTVVRSVLQKSQYWNVLRLTGLKPGVAIKATRLQGVGGPDGGKVPYSLCVQIGRLKGAGAYLIDRKAASAFVTGLLPMWLPWDHAVDREWIFGLTALSIAPFPISQTEEKFCSAIQGSSQPRLSSARRWLATYPYQICNELSRWFFRGGNLVALKLRLKG